MISSGLRFLFEFDGNRFGVTVLDGHAIALRAHGEVARHNPGAIQVAEQFACFFLHLFFFLGDVGNHVTQNVERSHARISGAADGLHGGRHHRLKTKNAIEWGESEYQADGRAVGIGHNEPARVAPPALAFEQLDVVGVYFRDDQRYVLVHAQRA